MKSRVAVDRRFVRGALGSLLALTVACEAPLPTVPLTGVWMGVAEETGQWWELVLVDLPPDEIWGTARTGSGTQPDISWGPPMLLAAQREEPIELVWETGSLSYRVDEPPSEDDPDHMAGTLLQAEVFPQRATSTSLALVKVRQDSRD